jgi:hypothetical protein
LPVVQNVHLLFYLLVTLFLLPLLLSLHLRTKVIEILLLFLELNLTLVLLLLSLVCRMLVICRMHVRHEFLSLFLLTLHVDLEELSLLTHTGLFLLAKLVVMILLHTFVLL